MMHNDCPPHISRDVETMLTQLWDHHPRTDGAPFRVPCNHPCSLMRDDMSKLTGHPHWVSPKVDGVRMFLLFSFVDDLDYATFVNRAGKITPVNIHAPLEAHSGTLLDGELVTDPTTGVATYLVFDAVAVNGYSLKSKPQSERMAGVVRMVASLRVEDPRLRVKPKRWFNFENANLSEVASSVEGIPTDGFIFVPECGKPIRPGPQRDHFKWKPVSHHTIDMVWRDGCLWLERAGVPERATALGVVGFELGSGGTLPPEEGNVVEVTLQPAPAPAPIAQWRAHFVRVRDDKATPNDMKVAELTLQNIVENIRLDELR